MIVIIKKARLAFPALFEPKDYQGDGNYRYMATGIVAPNHPQVPEIKAALASVARNAWGAKWETLLKALDAKDKLALHDGNTKPQHDGFEGNLFVASANKVRPLIIDRDMSPLTAADGRPYGGCYVNMKVELWAQKQERINAALLVVQFAGDGDAFGGSRPTIDGMEDLSQGADAEAFA